MVSGAGGHGGCATVSLHGHAVRRVERCIGGWAAVARESVDGQRPADQRRDRAVRRYPPDIAPVPAADDVATVR